MTSARAAETVTAVKSPMTRADFEIRIWLPLPIAVEFLPCYYSLQESKFR
jgi:hypothetical protein